MSRNEHSRDLSKKPAKQDNLKKKIKRKIQQNSDVEAALNNYLESTRQRSISTNRNKNRDLSNYSSNTTNLFSSTNKTQLRNKMQTARPEHNGKSFYNTSENGKSSEVDNMRELISKKKDMIDLLRKKTKPYSSVEKELSSIEGQLVGRKNQ